MADFDYAIVITKLSEEDGGGYGAFVPDLYGCMSDGATEQEALQNVRGAIAEWTDEARRLGRNIPAPGSATSEAQKTESDLYQLIREQDAFIKEQGAQVERLNAIVKEVRTVLEHRSEREQGPAPWDVLHFVAARAKEPKLPH